MFAKSFSAVKPNMVILNTGRSPELNQVLERLDALTGEHPSLAVSLFGYTEWLMYVKYNQEKFLSMIHISRQQHITTLIQPR